MVRVTESCVLACPVENVWQALAVFDFSWWGIVETSAIQREGSAVGVTVVLKFKDNTVQRFRVAEVSELEHSVTLELTDSQPPVSTMAQLHTLRLRPVTQSNETFVEWVTDFSFDAAQSELQDSKYKKLEAFQDMKRLFAPK
eukprot:PhM_4_TR1902/c0_g1_i1/m.87223